MPTEPIRLADYCSLLRVALTSISLCKRHLPDDGWHPGLIVIRIGSSGRMREGRGVPAPYTYTGGIPFQLGFWCSTARP